MPKYTFKVTNCGYDHPELIQDLPDKLASHRQGVTMFADLARASLRICIQTLNGR